MYDVTRNLLGTRRPQIKDGAPGFTKAAPMFSIALRHDEHTREYAVSASQPSGWELTLQEDLQRTRRVHFSDWHRVERAVAVVRLEVEGLTAQGWRIERTSPRL